MKCCGCLLIVHNTAHRMSCGITGAPGALVKSPSVSTSGFCCGTMPCPCLHEPLLGKIVKMLLTDKYLNCSSFSVIGKKIAQLKGHFYLID